MAYSLLREQLPVDDWILLPTAEIPGSRASIAIRHAHTRHIRHILFDIGKGKITNLSPENHKAVMDVCRSQYESYVFKCQQSGRTPMPFKHIGGGYIRWWKYQQKALYVRCDVPKKLREYENAA